MNVACCGSNKKVLKGAWRKRLIVSFFLPYFLFVPYNDFAMALPSGYSVESGDASFDTSSENKLVINASDKAIINFDSFSINLNETVQFVQPISSASVLSRVVGSSSSDIQGSLIANGQLVLVNPNGITFYETANVQVASLIASTLDIQNAMYMANAFEFEKKSGTNLGKILNEAQISVQNGGHVAFIADAVENKGTIVANMGSVAFAAGEKATVTFDNNGLINIVVNKGLSEKLKDGQNAIKNTGTVKANDGKVVMNAKMLNETFDNLINQSGVVEANRVEVRNGVVEIVADNGSVTTTGTVKAKEGDIKVEATGDIEVGGAYEALGGNILIDAGRDITIAKTTTTQGATIFQADRHIYVNADLTTDSGNLTLTADNDLDGIGSFYQAKDTTIKTTTFGDITLQASGDSTLSNIVSAGSLTLSQAGSVVNYTQYLDSKVITNASLTINKGTTLIAANTVFEISKNWTNLGSFIADLSKVNLVSPEDSIILGVNTFNDLTVIQEGKKVSFEAEKTQEIVGTLTLKGSFGKLVVLRSTSDGTPWNIKPLGAREIVYTDIKDAANIHNHGPPVQPLLSKNSLGNSGFDFSLSPVVFTGNGNSPDWSNFLNWNGGFVPGIGDDVVFTSASPSATTVILSPEGAKNPIAIASLTLESGYLGKVTLKSDLKVTGDVSIFGGSVVMGSFAPSFDGAQDDVTLSVGGNWTLNGGNFDAGTSTVVFNDASKPSSIYGSNTFYNFSSLTPSKVIQFEAGELQTITGTWKIEGAYAQHVRLVSTQKGAQWKVNPSGVRDLSYAWVEDSDNVNPERIIMTESTNRGNSINWDPTVTWAGTSGGNWSNGANWSGSGGAEPGTGDDVVFNGTDVDNSAVDAAFAGSIGSLSINAGYTGTITLSRALVVTTSGALTGNFSQADGTFNAGANDVTVEGTFTLSGGTFTAPSSTLNISSDFTTSGAPTFNGNSGTISFGGAANTTFTDGVGITLANVIDAKNSANLYLASDMTISGNFTQNGDAGGYTRDNDGVTLRTIFLSGAYSETANNLGDANAMTRLEFTGTAAQTVSQSGGAFAGNLKINKASNTVTQSTALTIEASGGSMTLTSGTYATGSQTHANNGSFSQTGGTFSAGSGTHTFGSFSLTGGTFNATSGTTNVPGDFTTSGAPTFNGNSGTISFGGAGNGTFTDGAGITLANVIDAKTSANLYLASDMTISGNFTQNGDAGGYTRDNDGVTLRTIFLSGAYSETANNLGDANAMTRLEFTGTAAQTFSKTGGSFSALLRINKSSGTVSLNNNLTIADSGTLTITSGTFYLKGKNLTVPVGSAFSNTGTFQLQGAETITNLTQDTAGGTWTYVGDGDSAADTYTLKDWGDTDYYNLTINSTDGTTDIFQKASTAMVIANNLTVTAGIFSLNGQNITVTATVSNDATIRSKGSETITFTTGNDVNSGTWQYVGDGDAGADTFTIKDFGDNDYYNLTIASTDGTTDTFRITSAANIDGAFSVTAGTFDQTTVTMNVAGSFSLSASTAFTKSSNGSALTFDGTGSLTDSNATVKDLGAVSISGDSTRTLGAATKMTSLTIASGSTFALAGFNFDFSAAASVSNSGTYKLQGGETLTNVNDLDIDSGTVTYVGNGDGTQDTHTMRDFGDTDYYNLTINDANGTKDIFSSGGAKVIAGALNVTSGTYTANTNTTTVTGLATVNGGTYTASTATQTFNAGLTVSSGTFTGDSGNLDVNGTLTISGGTFTASSSNESAQVSGNLTISGAPTFNHNSGTFAFDGAANQTVTTNAVTFSGFKVNNAGNTIIISGNLDVDGTLNIAAGTLDLSTNNPNVTAAGNVTIASGALVTKGTGSWTFDGNAAKTYTDSNATPQNIGAVTINKNHATASNNKITLGSGMTVDTLVISASNTLDLAASSYTLTLANAGATGTVLTNSGTFTPGTSTVKYTATNSGGNITVADVGYNSLQFSAAETYVPAANLVVTGTLKVDTASAIFNANAKTVTATGLVTVSNGTYQASTATQTFNGGLTVSGGTFTGSSGTVDVNGSLTVSSGTMTAPSGDLQISTNFDHSSGTFTHNSGTVTLDSATTATISGSSTFNNLSSTTAGKQINFTAGTTQTIGGTFTITGAAANLIKLRSTSAGSTYTITDSGTESVSYADVKDSIATNGITAANSTSSGNNSGWTFSASTVTWTGTSSTGWTTAGNWDSGYVPASTDNVVIANVDNDPVLAGVTTVNNLTINASGILSLNGNDLTVSGTFINNGTFKLQGFETISITQDTDSGTWQYVGNADGVEDTYTLKDFGDTDYYNLTINDTNATQDFFVTAAALTVGGAFTMSDGNFHPANNVTSTGNMQFDTAVRPSAAITFDAGTSTITFNSILVLGSNAVIFTADAIDFLGGANSVTGTSSITLQPSADATTIGIGGGAGTLGLSTTDIAALANGFSGITIGRSGGSGAIAISAITFNDPVTIRSPSGAGSIAVNGQITGSGNASITLDGPGATTTLAANIVTAGNAVTISDSVSLSTSARTIDTTNAGASGGANITITGTIDGAQALTLTAGTGDVDLTGVIGGTTALSSLTITGNDISLNSIGDADTGGVGGATSVTASTSGADIGSITLANTTYKTDGSITLVSPADVAGQQSITTGGAPGPITITTTGDDVTVTTASIGIDVSLTINTAGGNVSLNNVGGTLANDFTVNAGAGTASIGVIDSGINTVDITASTITLNGDVGPGDAAGNSVTLTGAVTLGANVTINTDWDTNDGAVSFSSTIDGPKTLTITAGGGTVTFSGAIGGTTPVTSLAVTSTAGITTRNVTTRDVASNTVTFTGPVTLGASTTITTNNVTNDGNISFTSTINGAQDLTLTAGTGDVTFGDTIGGTTALSSLTITGNDIIAIPNIGAGVTAGVTGATSITGSTAGADIGSIEFAGTLYNTNAITLVSVADDAGQQSIVATAGATVTFTTTGDDVTVTTANVGLAGSTHLVINTAGGNVSLNNVGGSVAEDLTINAGAGTASIGVIDSGINTVDITASTITLNGDVGPGDAAGNNVTFTGPVTLGANLTIDTDNPTNDGNITFSSTINGAQGLTFTAGGANLSISGTVGGVTSLTSFTPSGVLTSALTVTGTMNVSSGTFDANGNTVTASGLVTVDGGTYLARTATQTFNGGLTITGGTFTGSTGDVDINGTFTQTGGTITAPSATMFVSGNFTRSAGTFTHNSGTVKLDGADQTISGDTTFYNLRKSVDVDPTLTFAAASIQTILNILRLEGTSAAILYLRSGTTGTQWKIDPQATRTVSFLDVKDSNNVNATALNAVGFNVTDSGNNINWTFVAAVAAVSSGSGVNVIFSNGQLAIVLLGFNPFNEPVQAQFNFQPMQFGGVMAVPMAIGGGAVGGGAGGLAFAAPAPAMMIPMPAPAMAVATPAPTVSSLSAPAVSNFAAYFPGKDKGFTIKNYLLITQNVKAIPEPALQIMGQTISRPGMLIESYDTFQGSWLLFSRTEAMLAPYFEEKKPVNYLDELFRDDAITNLSQLRNEAGASILIPEGEKVSFSPNSFRFPSGARLVPTYQIMAPSGTEREVIEPRLQAGEDKDNA